MKYSSWYFQIGAGFQSGNIFSSVLSFRTKSVLSEWLSLKLKLTSNDTDLGKTLYMKVVDNFDTFPESIYTASSDKWSRSNDLWKSGGCCWNFQFSRQIGKADLFWGLSIHPGGNRGNSKHKSRRRLYYLSDMGYISIFRYRMKKF
jgi:hypothetical protein